MFKGYYINGVAVKDNGSICFLAKKIRDDLDPVLDEELYKKRLVVYHHNEHGDEQWGDVSWSGRGAMCIATIIRPLSQVIVADMNGYIYAIGSGAEEGNQIPDEPVITNIRSIDGYAYVAGTFRYVAKRGDNNNWQELNNGIKRPNLKEANSIAGFEFIDGFSETEMYAGGGKGDLWQFNGETWCQVPFPSDMLLESICCGQDGFVYIGVQSGTVFKGRNDEWRMIHCGNLALPFRQMVWYQDRVWATSDYGVWKIVDDEVIRADLPSEVSVCAGYIDCNDKTLVLASINGAARLENEEWDILIDCFEAEENSDNQ
ncbi:hypothetical protein [Snodgrassella communis]|uniref:hypothetical protein n=1 Tax=Snodgrassella communis TaxID=2946699 RepID=UPI00286B2015|nr:hypothetical protein [Snodgrassella communis]WMY91804.1 hypothetical protein PYG29_10365 [Snodgrassella communis]